MWEHNFLTKYAAHQTFRGQVHEAWISGMVLQFSANSVKFLFGDGKYYDPSIFYLLPSAVFSGNLTEILVQALVRNFG